MKRLISLLLALALILSMTTALAERKEIDGTGKRKIKIKTAGLNPSAEEMIAQGISPTTGRYLDEIDWQDGFLGVAVTGKYIPVMVQVSNSSNGFNSSEYINAGGDPYKTAPVNGEYADIVYEVCQASNGTLTRMTYIYSDVIPDYVGFIRSTRYTHVRLRQEWDCNFLTSGYADYITDEWTKYKVPNPMGGDRGKDPGPVYVGGVGNNKPWKKYYCALTGISDSNNKLYKLVGKDGEHGLIDDPDLAPVFENYKYANHTWLFSDELPKGGDTGEIIYVTFGHKHQTDSRLEYDPDTKTYTRWVNVPKYGDQPYSGSRLYNVTMKKDKVTAERVLGEPITFTNVIVQGIKMNWPGDEMPDPVLTGKGNADYFMGGKHYAGVWERKDMDSRTVFYGADGKEIKLQRGRTLVILMNYNNKTTSVAYE